MYTLLLVDDEQEIRSGLSQYFPWHEVGFELVGQCADGREALQFLEKRAVDVLLCDIRMPILSGLEVAQQLYERKSGIKVVFLSGYKDFDYAKQAMTYGIQHYIVKPTKYTELFDVFSSLKLEFDEATARDTGQSEVQSASFNAQVIAAIQAYVESNYAKATLEEAAGIVHMNPHYVSKYFKEKTGENFSDYVTAVKMARAAELLRDIRYKTYEVSEMVGYSYAKNFTRTFKRVHGVSPREYRNNYEGTRD
ncbi:response regulator transcription factor [Paenibacillus daejeonensis]|uniref:response regulator transcription factor n=1 Tax=Paenibacillus daejeonensis TaxID=135193 RepID=UPI00036783E3|nr:response regulator [Paenibacillus daejeonensis]